MHQAVAAPETAPKVARKRRSTRKRQIIIGAVGFLVLWLIVSILLSKREKPIPVTTEKAVRKTILQTVSATGKVQPETEVKISPEVAGEIIELPVADGMGIKKGDLLVKIKTDSYKALLEEQEAGRAHWRHRAIRRHRSDARGRPFADASRDRCKRERRSEREDRRQGECKDRRLRRSQIQRDGGANWEHRKDDRQRHPGRSHQFRSENQFGTGRCFAAAGSQLHG